MQTNVRISVATPEADLQAVVQPGVATILYPRCDSPVPLQRADDIISRLEKLRGIRPGTVRLHALIESPQGVCAVTDIAASSARLGSLGTGPHLDLDGDALEYARGECELAARSLGIAALNFQTSAD